MQCSRRARVSPPPPNPNDRFRDAWEALLAIADTAGGKWAGTGGRAWRTCRAIGADTNDETGAREMLLADLQVVFADKGNPNALPTKVILEAPACTAGGVHIRAVVLSDDRAAAGGLVLNAEFLRFAAHWGFLPRSCRPYRARTKGKVERPIRYIR